MDALSQETIAILGVGVVLAGFFWSLHRDVAGLRERVSRLEGLYEGLRDSVARLQESVGELSKSVGDCASRSQGCKSRLRGCKTRSQGCRVRFAVSSNEFDNRYHRLPAPTISRRGGASPERDYSVRTRVSAGRQLTKRRAPRSARTGPRSVLGTVAESRTPSAVTRKRWVSLP